MLLKIGFVEGMRTTYLLLEIIRSCSKPSSTLLPSPYPKNKFNPFDSAPLTNLRFRISVTSKEMADILCLPVPNIFDKKKYKFFNISLQSYHSQWRIQKILVGGDLKHKTSKIRMSSPKLRVIFRPKSEIQPFFSPKFRWSPK